MQFAITRILRATSHGQSALTSRNLLNCILAFPCLILAGCGQQSNQAVSTQSSQGLKTDRAEVAKIILALNWFPEAEHGGYYAAVVHGYYAEEGLQVSIRPGGPKVPVLADVASGTVDFAVDNADKLLLSRVQQAENVAVMAPIQNSPRCIMVHKGSGLKSLEDLKDKRPFTLAMNAGQPYAQFLKKKVDLTDVQIVAYHGNVAQFLLETNYGQQAYSFSEPYLAEQKGGDPMCLMLSDLGFNTYTSILVCSREKIDKQSDLVGKMVRASIRGWKKYLSDPDETNKHIHKENVEMPMDVLEFGVAALKPLCVPDGFEAKRIGEMTSDRWQTLIDQMSEIGLIKKGTVPAKDAFTSLFLDDATHK